MKHDQLQAVIQRQEYLILRSAAQRARMVRTLRDFEKPAALADRAIALGSYLKAHPLLITMGAVSIVALRPRAALKWLQGGFIVWRIARSAAAFRRELPRN